MTGDPSDVTVGCEENYYDVDREEFEERASRALSGG
jgi:hypothetical protein